MSKFFKLLFRVFVYLIFLILLLYVAIPSPRFPSSLSDSVQSLEDADTETPLRRAYFTNFERNDVLGFYEKQMSAVAFGIPLPNYRLNYPPEEAYTWIRDQTRSTYLEEIVTPFRDSFFVNGFKPRLAKDDIWYKGLHFGEKVTVRYVPSSVVTRVVLMFGSLTLLLIISQEFINALWRLLADWRIKRNA